MTDQSDFTVEVYQNEYLAANATEVNAVVSVTATGSPTGSVPAAAEVIIVDFSGSMRESAGSTNRTSTQQADRPGHPAITAARLRPPTKLAAAQQATIAAVSVLRDGVEFAVVAGTHDASLIYPPHHGLAVASPRTRAEAVAAVQRCVEEGGTAIGEWLRFAGSLFATTAAGIKHAILLTDGQNVSETPEEFTAALWAVTGSFVCDCRGVGTDWEVAELRRIAEVLLGTVDIVAEPAGLEADFIAMTRHAMSKAVADVTLRLWTPQGATVGFVKQVEPTLTDLTGRRTDGPPRCGDYPTGSWGTETRDYHVCVRVPAGARGERMLAGRVGLVVPGHDGSPDLTLGTGRIIAVWTDDTSLSTRINREVAHYTGQAELAAAIQEGLEARKAGDVETATAKLGRAVALATATGHADTARLLAKVVDIEDARAGTVRLKRDVAAVDEMTLDTRSSKTMRVRRRADDAGAAPAGDGARATLSTPGSGA